MEEYINGRELNVAILGNRPPVALPISEIDFSGLTDGMHHIVSYAAKWMEGTVAYEGTKGVCPAKLPADVNWKEDKEALPGRKLDPKKAPKVYLSEEPAEMILVAGEPKYQAVKGAGELLWVANTDSDLFRLGPTGPRQIAPPTSLPKASKR